MGIIVRQSISNTVISYIGIALGFVLTILMFPHILTPDQYGLTRVLISASFISSQFAHLGFQNLVIRYYPFFKKAAPEKHGFLFWIITIPVIGFLIFSAVYLVASDTIIQYYSERSPLFVDYYLWVIPLTLFIIYFEVLNNYLRSLRDSTTGSVVNEVLQRFISIIVLAIYFFEWISFGQFITFFILSYLSQPLIVGIQIWRKQELQLVPNFSIIRKKLIKGMASYSLYSMLGGLTTVIVWNVDIMMLGSMAGLDDTAVYSIAFYICTVITVPQQSIYKIAAPLLSDFIKSKQWGEVETIYKKSSLNQIIPGLLIFGLIWLHLDKLYMILPDIYAAGLWVVFIVGIGKLTGMVCGLNGVILSNSKHYRVSFYTNIILVVITVVANYLLIPAYGIEGAALASAMAIIIYNGVKYLYVLIKMKLQPFSMKTLWVILLGAFTIYISHAWVDFSSIWLDMVIKSIIFPLTFLAPILYFKVSPDINELLESLRTYLAR
ncbi:oligosaccharide flippase family protein [Rhodohalobacter sulfatireducens]|uniref:Oligosaccharide flippase family protein n=1 Tax=Rhodohalobacter sulfatireducens TaxID=2911366 RepID=A0ABS9KAY5_9BACT|nr:oligosaccharide flippase family protein [Rhodohalobacter sulfatireducens]MCG2588013.1 oligosaccharide flippase family protein [Rhodohalobacter sulfatireducens]MDR9365021.1 oligosaccharide flippase family protein [Balneolaceae bacterium]MDR9407985.1 oligosaccharide flippase family protein [Balneolaceae bacterium]